MTKEQMIRKLKKLGKGEYYMGNMEAIFVRIANKSEYTVSPITGDKCAKLFPLVEFCEMFNECKYGLEYATKGKIRYIGTNDMDTLIIS